MDGYGEIWKNQVLASAVPMAAQAVCHMPLGRISAHTTSNVGVIECDGATNVVPGTCWLLGECRSTSLERARAERSAMDEAMRAAAAQAGGSVDIEWRTDVAVIGIPHEKWGETALAVVVRAPGTEVTEQEIIDFSRERLARFKCPTRVEWADVLPRNPSGKVLKKDLREPYWAGRERRVN